MSGNNARLGFEQSIREGERESEQEKSYRLTIHVISFSV